MASFAFSQLESDTREYFVWKSNSIKIFIGVYQDPAILLLSSGEKFSKTIEELSLTGEDASQFNLTAIDLTIVQGQASHEFKFIAKSTSTPRLYQLSFIHKETSTYAPIPPLNVQVTADQCSIVSEYSSYTILNGGQSLPVVFDFSNCMPEIDVTMNGEAITTIEGQAVTSPYVTFTENNKTIHYSSTSIAKQISFILKGIKESGADQPDSPQATLKFTFTGTNANSFIFTQEITLIVVDAITEVPVLTVDDITSDIPGKQSFKVQCSQVSVIYYAVSQSKEEIDVIQSYQTIQNQTLNQNIQESNLNKILTNQYKTIYGYALQTTAATSIDIIITEKIESATTYYGRMICVNENLVQSQNQDFSWTQASNDGKPLIYRMLFLSITVNDETRTKLTAIQRNEITCKIAELTYISKDYVLNSGGNICNESYTENSTTTNSKSTLRFLQTTNYTMYDEYIIILPDPYIAESTEITKAQTIMSSSDFPSILFSSLSSNFKAMMLQEYSLTSIDTYPIMPVISSPIIIASESSIELTFTMKNSNGFVFAGLILKNNSNNPPSFIQVKSNQGYQFTAYQSEFLRENIPTTIQFKQLTAQTKYMYYWIATNEYPDTIAFQTGLRISPENITTIGSEEEEVLYFEFGYKFLDCFMQVFIILILIIN